MPASLALAGLVASLVAAQAAGEAQPPGTTPNPASSSGTLPSSQPGSSPAIVQTRPRGDAPLGLGEEGAQPGTGFPVLDLSLRLDGSGGLYRSPTTGASFVTQIFVTPSIGALLGRGTVTTRAVYDPQIQVVFSGPQEGTYVVQRLRLDLDVLASPAWTLFFRAAGSYGTRNWIGQPASSGPPGTAPSPTPISTATSATTWTGTLVSQATGRVGTHQTLRFTATLGGQGGINLESQVTTPPEVTLRLDGALELVASRDDLWTTNAYVQGMRMRRPVPSGDGYVDVNRESLVAGAMEIWRRRLDARTESYFGLGFAYVNFDSTGLLVYDRFMPSGEIRIQRDVPLEPGEIPAAGEERLTTSRLQFSSSAVLAPFIDTYTALAYNRLVVTAAGSWTLRDNWRTALGFSAGLDFASERSVRRYGGATATATWATTRYLTLEGGLYWQAQGGSTQLVYTYSEWGLRISMLLHDRLRL